MTTSNESTLATSSAQQSASHVGFWAQVRSSLLPHLAAIVGAVWSVFLFIGGLIFECFSSGGYYMATLSVHCDAVVKMKKTAGDLKKSYEWIE